MSSKDALETKPSRRSTPGSWLIPLGLLTVGLITASAFFLANSTSPSGTTVPAADIARPTRGGVLRVPLDSTLMTLDPARAEWAPEIMVIQQIYDGLTALDEHLNVVPALARYWEISHDGKIYTFELRDDAFFHNGRPVTAEDCVYSFERLLTPGLNTNNYHYFSRIEGAREFREGLATHVSGLRALDEKTFQIRFASPFVPALSVLSMFCSKVLPKTELLEKEDEFFMAPIGTGPFRFSRWIDREEDPTVPFAYGISQALRLEANPNYFGSGPYLDAVVFRSLANAPGTEQARPLSETFDYLPYMGKELGEKAGWVAGGPVKLLSLRYLVLPTDVPPYNNPRVRLALSYALDKEEYLDLSPRTAGSAAASSIVPPGIPGFLPVEDAPEKNLERAKSLLAEAGYPDGKGLPPLEVFFYPSQDGAQRDSLERCLAHVGLKLKEMPEDQWIEERDGDHRGRPTLQLSGWIADFPDPDNFLRPLFHSTSPVNLSRYHNPEVDRLLDQVWSETSYSLRNKLYHKIENLVLRDAPVIPLYYDSLRYLIRSKVRGLSISPMGPAYIQLNRVWLSDEETTAPADL